MSQSSRIHMETAGTATWFRIEEECDRLTSDVKALREEGQTVTYQLEGVEPDHE